MIPRAFALALLVNGSAALAQPAPAETTPDPQALVGEWAVWRPVSRHARARRGVRIG